MPVDAAAIRAEAAPFLLRGERALTARARNLGVGHAPPAVAKLAVTVVGADARGSRRTDEHRCPSCDDDAARADLATDLRQYRLCRAG